MEQRSIAGQTANTNKRTRPLPDPNKLYMTHGVQAWVLKQLDTDYLIGRVREAYDQQPDTTTDGSDNKFGFRMVIYGKAFFVVANQVGGLTVMLAEEH